MAIEKPKVTPGGVIFDALKKACQEEVRNLPAADVEEVKHGRWHDVYMSSASSFVGTCSICGIANDIPPVSLAKYCPNCGAKMDGAINNG